MGLGGAVSALAPFPARSLLGVLGDLTEHGGCAGLPRAGRTGGNNGRVSSWPKSLCLNQHPALPPCRANPGKHNAGADSPVGVTTTALGGWWLGANLPVGLGSSKLAFVLQIHHVMDLLTMS